MRKSDNMRDSQMLATVQNRYDSNFIYLNEFTSISGAY